MRWLIITVVLGAACTPTTVHISSPDHWLYPDSGADASGRDAGASDRSAGDGVADAAANDGRVDGGSWPDAPAIHRVINFQPSGSNPPSGAEADYGDPLGLRGYGWGRDLTAKTERADLLTDDLLDTYIVAGDVSVVDQWQIRLPEARYLVTLAAGKPEAASGPVRILAEGVPLVDGDAPLRNDFLWVVDREIGVHDGMLTLDVGTGAGPSVLNFVEIESAFPSGACTVRAEVCNGVSDDCDSLVDEDGACDQPTTICYQSTLASSADVSNAGFSLRGGSFVDGGLRIDAPGTRVERTLNGNFYRGSIAFEAKGLSWQMPLASAATACARSVFDLNHGTARDATRSRLFLQNRAADCGGGSGGTLRLTMPSAFCCLDSSPLPTADDGQWHSYRVTWDAALVVFSVDDSEAARTEYHGPSVGRDPVLWFGSAGGSGDASGATFKNLQVCNEVP